MRDSVESQCVQYLEYAFFLTHSNYLHTFTQLHEERLLPKKHLFTTNHRDWACEC